MSNHRRHRRDRRSSSMASTNLLENTIERLLDHGARITAALEQEVEYAQKQHGNAPRRDCPAVSASVSRSSLAPTASATASRSPPPAPSSKAVSKTKSSSKANSASVPADSGKKSSETTVGIQKQGSSIFHHAPGLPGWPPAPPSDMSHTYDLDDVPSLPCSQNSFTSVTGMSSKTSSKAPSKKASASSSADNVEDITSDMLEPPALSSKTALKTGVNDAMPKPSDIFLGVKHFPCFVRENESSFERSARVTMHRRTDSQWIVLCVEVEGPRKENMVIVRCELLGRLVRNVFVNGNRAE